MRLVWPFSCKTAPPKLWGAETEIWPKSRNSVFMRTRELFVCTCTDKGRRKCSLGNTRSIFFTLENQGISVRKIFTKEFCYLWAFCPMKSEKVPSLFLPQIILFSFGGYLAKIMGFYLGWKLELFNFLLNSFCDHSGICSWGNKGFTGVHFFFLFVIIIRERIITHL